MLWPLLTQAQNGGGSGGERDLLLNVSEIAPSVKSEPHGARASLSHDHGAP